MKASYIMLNILFAFGLFFLNALLGRIQYGLSGKLFQYGKFTFADAEQQNFSGNFFQKIVNPAVYLPVAPCFFTIYPRLHRRTRASRSPGSTGRA